jgi:integrase-like protein
MTALRRHMLEDMQVRNLSPHIQTTYVQHVARFARHFQQSPEALGPREIRAYQLYLTRDRKLGVLSVLIAVAALRFLYKVTLKQPWRIDEVWLSKTRYEDRALDFDGRHAFRVSPCGARLVMPPGMRASAAPHDAEMFDRRVIGTGL